MIKYLQRIDNWGLLLLVIAVLSYSVTNQWKTWNISLAIAGGVLVVIGFAANYKRILESLGKRSTKYATNYVVSVILLIAIVIGLNFIGQRHAKRYDLTQSGQYTLAPQTTQILEKLDQELEIKAFFPGGEYPPLKQLLVEYRTVSRHMSYEFIDPDRHPDIAKHYSVSVYGSGVNPLTQSPIRYGTVVLIYDNRREKIEKRSEEVREQDLTNAIIKIQRSGRKQLYFVQGHGEKDIEDTEREGYSEAKKALEEQAFDVATLNLASEGKVPEDASVVVLAGPTTEPFPQEMDYLTDFLNTGKGVLVMVDPSPAQGLESFLKVWGVTPDNDVVLDVSGAGRLMGAGPGIPLVLSYETHRITDRFDAMTFFPLVRSIHPSEKSVEGVSVEPLFKSSPQGWGETDFENTEKSFDENVDLQGPLTLAVAASKEISPAEDDRPATSARMVVVGDSDFAVNTSFGAQGNGNLFLNMVSWLAQDEDLISIRPKPPEDRRITLSQSEQSLLRLLTIFVLPGIVLVSGIVVWNRRKR